MDDLIADMRRIAKRHRIDLELVFDRYVFGVQIGKRMMRDGRLSADQGRALADVIRMGVKQGVVSEPAALVQDDLVLARAIGCAETVADAESRLRLVQPPIRKGGA